MGNRQDDIDALSRLIVAVATAELIDKGRNALKYLGFSGITPRNAVEIHLAFLGRFSRTPTGEDWGSRTVEGRNLHLPPDPTVDHVLADIGAMVSRLTKTGSLDAICR